MRPDASQEACGNAPLQVGTSDRRTCADAVTRGRHRSPWRVPLLYDAASSLTSLKARTIELRQHFRRVQRPPRESPVPALFPRRLRNPASEPQVSQQRLPMQATAGVVAT